MAGPARGPLVAPMSPPTTLEEALERLTVIETVMKELEKEGALARSQQVAADLRCAGEGFLPLRFFLPLLFLC